jgi:hypothetical protein
MRKQKHESAFVRHSRWTIVGRVEKQTMKTKEQNAKSVKVEVVREAVSIDALLTTNEAGYMHAANSIQEVPTVDLVRYIGEKVEAGQSALRLAVLFAGAVYRTCTKEKFDLFADGLNSSWGSMSKDILSIGRALPKLEASGLTLSKVRDLYGLRDVRALVLGDDTAKAKKAVALLNEGKAPRKVRAEVIGEKPQADGSTPKAESAKVSPEVAAPAPDATPEDKAGIASALILNAAEKVAASIDHDDRVKLALQVIAKMKLAGWSLQKVK